MRCLLLLFTLTLVACGDPPSEWATNTPPATQTQETRGVEDVLTATPMPTMTLTSTATPELPTPTRIIQLPGAELHCPEPAFTADGHLICHVEVMNQTDVYYTDGSLVGNAFVPGQRIAIDLTLSHDEWCALTDGRTVVSCWDVAVTDEERTSFHCPSATIAEDGQRVCLVMTDSHAVEYDRDGHVVRGLATQGSEFLIDLDRISGTDCGVHGTDNYTYCGALMAVREETE